MMIDKGTWVHKDTHLGNCDSHYAITGWKNLGLFKDICGAGDMVQWLGALDALSEDPGLGSIIHVVTHNCNSSSRGPKVFF